MTVLLVVHAVAGGAILLTARWLRRWAFAAGAVPMVASLAYAAGQGGRVVDGEASVEHQRWVSQLELAIDLRMDAFALLMVLVISGIGAAVMAYGAWYFNASARAARTAGLLVLFAGSMLGVVLADNAGVLYLFWELTSVTSFLLIGGDHATRAARAAARHALLLTGAGGLALLAGLVLIAQAAGTWSISGILADPPTGTAAGVGLALVVLAIITKSAQYPTHAWLPQAMVAPTPVSAYLHSATMVKAGIYLAARLAPAFVAVAAGWRPAIVTIGLVTMLAGGVRALRQHDLKLLLAMGTVSQLGFLLVLFGVGLPEATAAGCALLIGHALFKAALFLVVGIVDHEAGTRDRRELAGFGTGWTGVKVAATVAAASMAGLPPLLGFVAKEAAYESFLHEGAGGAVVLAGLVAGSVLTVAYSARFLAPILSRPAVAAASPPAPAGWFVAPALVLSALTVAAGLAPGALLGRLVERAAIDLDATVDHVDLALWHGLNTALLLSGVTLAVGALLVAGRRVIARVLDAVSPRFGGAEAYAATVQGLEVVSHRTTGVVQSGSLPVYIAVIITTAVAVPGVVLVARAPWPGWPDLWQTPLQGVVGAVVVGAAMAAAVVTRRLAAVLVLGAVGFGTALLFVIQGAPDLALTQFAVETLSLVAFVLVLRFLPDRFERRRRPVRTPLRLAVAGVVAIGVFGFALLSSGHRRLEPVSDEIVARSLPEGGGRNVVNVILVDVRGLDTLGEISVLFVAGLGAVALTRVGRRQREAAASAPPEPTESPEPGDAPAPEASR